MRVAKVAGRRLAKTAAGGQYEGGAQRTQVWRSEARRTWLGAHAEGHALATGPCDTRRPICAASVRQEVLGT